MYRYIALVWDEAIPHSNAFASLVATRLTEESEGWEKVLTAKGILAYHIKDRSNGAYPLHGGHGVVLGKLFRSSTDPEQPIHHTAFDERETIRIEESSGRHIVDQFWGRYVAIIPGGTGVLARVIRDPAGTMPCFITASEGVHLICSDVEDCQRLGILRTSINWEHVVAYLWLTRLVTAQTGLRQIRRVHAGECITVRRDRLDSAFLWTPMRVLDSGTIDEHASALERLRASVLQCVRSWASCYSRILHELSGGLDSTIVLSSMRECSAAVVCQTFFTHDAEGDERRFARLVAKRQGLELIETLIRPSAHSLPSMFDSRLTASPTENVLVPEYARAREELIEDRGIEAVFSGQGGDHFFQRNRTPLIAAEYTQRHGLARGTLRVAIDTSRLTRRPFWSVFAIAFMHGLFCRHGHQYLSTPEVPKWLDGGSRDASVLQNARHPWLETAGHLPGGKILQIADIVISQTLGHLRSRSADIVHPLISQPVIETCLKIPSYRLTYGGVDRALARDAFSDLIPPEVAQRTMKGGTSGYVVGTLTANLRELRGFLVDGLLAREHILDRALVLKELTEEGLIRNPRLLFPTLSAVQAESWLRKWTNAMQRQIA